MRTWEPQMGFVRWVVAQCVYSDWLGSGYRFARERGRVKRFWTERAAQAYADQLNAKADPTEPPGGGS